MSYNNTGLSSNCHVSYSFSNSNNNNSNTGNDGNKLNCKNPSSIDTSKLKSELNEFGFTKTQIQFGINNTNTYSIEHIVDCILKHEEKSIELSTPPLYSTHEQTSTNIEASHYIEPYAPN
eukprot:349336_1